MDSEANARLQGFQRDFRALLYKHGFEKPVFIHEGIVFDHYAIGVSMEECDDVYFAIGQCCPVCKEQDEEEGISA